MSFFDQAFTVTEVTQPRADWLAMRYREARVLHVGCADWPMKDLESNLHAKLAGKVRRLDGLDISPEGLAWIRERIPGDYFASMSAVAKYVQGGARYEAVIAPEVIEHVPNAGDFLRSLFLPDPREVLVTAPNGIVHREWNWDKRTGYFRETVHPDHVAWYSPYTLLRAVKEVAPTEWGLEVFLLEDAAQVAVAARRP